MLKASLETFDLKDVECHLAADRAFVSLAITAWYGSGEAFTEYIRGPLRDELLAGSELELPMSHLFRRLTSLNLLVLLHCRLHMSEN